MNLNAEDRQWVKDVVEFGFSQAMLTHLDKCPMKPLVEKLTEQQGDIQLSCTKGDGFLRGVWGAVIGAGVLATLAIAVIEIGKVWHK